MKKKLFVLIVLLIAVVTFSYAQSKKDIEEDLIKCTADKDSIQNLLTGLSESHDSIIAVCVAYDTMYNAIKEKVFLDDFDPANMSELIDSLQTKVFSGTSVLNDSISALHVENVELKAKIESMAAGIGDKTEIVDSLKQLKELLDENIITQEEYDAKKAVLIEKL